MKVLWIDFAQPSTWSGLLGLASLAGITLGSESIAALSAALAGAVHAYEVLRDERAAPDADPGFNDR